MENESFIRQQKLVYLSWWSHKLWQRLIQTANSSCSENNENWDGTLSCDRCWPTDSNKWKDNDLTADRELESDLNHLTWTVIHVLFDILPFKSSFSFIPHWVFYSSRSPFSLFLDKMLKVVWAEEKMKHLFSVWWNVSSQILLKKQNVKKDRFRRQTLDIDQN